MTTSRTVTLHDGSKVDSWSEDWRAECEARLVLSWPLQRRRDFIATIATKRGQGAQQVLMDRMAAIHAAKRPSRGAG